jgi:DNA-binding MarR family transcriptional regulator
MDAVTPYPPPLSLIRNHLSAIQSRILVALFQSENQQFMPNELVLEKTCIAQSTWSEEQKRLIDMGLLEKKAFKTIRTNNVCRIVNFRLTSKGRTVAFNLVNISRMIVQGQNIPLEASASLQTPLSIKDLEYEIMEAVEVALDSFGINLIPLVKSRLPENVSWVEVARRPEILIVVLRDLFGKDGSSTVESMIAENLKSRFAIAVSLSLPELVAELKQKKAVGTTVTQETALPLSQSRFEK